MNQFNPDASLVNMWKAYHNMPSKTTILDRIIEKEKAAQQSEIQNAVAEATSRDHIQSKKVEGLFFERLERAKQNQSENTIAAINEIRRFIGKGMKVDQYV